MHHSSTALLLLLHAIDATVDATVVEDFRKNGFVIVHSFATPEEVAAMKAAMQEKTDAYWAERSDPTVFRTDAGQEAAQARSRKFFESADRVEFFEEADGKALNKAGHALHLGDDAFGTYATSKKVRALLRDLGYERPVLPQSMYIFKAPLHGGAVTSHQDATFLRTDPDQTVVGLWLALDDATPENGCVWARAGSHREPLRRVFVRDRDRGEANATMVFVRTPPGRFYFAERLGGPGPEARAVVEAPWEGADMTEADAREHGFAPLPARAGDLVLIAGTVDHLSFPNKSPQQRHTFQLHVIESAGTAWHAANWLQTDRVGGFLPLGVEESGEL